MISWIKGIIISIRDYEAICLEFANTMFSYNALQEAYAELSKELAKIEKDEVNENYWNNRRKKVNKQWKARDGVNMDVRCFFQRDCTLTKFTGSFDDIAKKALGYVIATVRYESDKGEFWQYAYETKLVGTGDCDDMAIYVANLLWNNGVPYYKIRLNKGYVSYKGSRVYHAWCTYLAEDNNWYVLDAAYFPKESTGLKLKWKEAEKYLNVDASWNPEFSFGGLKK